MEHERLLAQRDTTRRNGATLRARFEEEDAARQAEFDAAARESREPELPEVTSEDARRDALMNADARIRAASHALQSFGIAAVERLRGDLPPGWHAAEAVNGHQVPPDGAAAEIVAKLDAQAADARRREQEARRALAEADRELRAAVPLRMWLIRTANAGTDGAARLEPGDGLETPPAFTAGSKPRDLDVPGWHRTQPVGPSPPTRTTPIHRHERRVVRRAGARGRRPRRPTHRRKRLMTKKKATGGGTGMLRELGRNQNSADPAQLITTAIKEGRITADERAHYTARFKSDPDGTRKLLRSSRPVARRNPSRRGRGCSRSWAGDRTPRERRRRRARARGRRDRAAPHALTDRWPDGRDERDRASRHAGWEVASGRRASRPTTPATVPVAGTEATLRPASHPPEPDPLRRRAERRRRMRNWRRRCAERADPPRPDRAHGRPPRVGSTRRLPVRGRLEARDLDRALLHDRAPRRTMGRRVRLDAPRVATPTKAAPRGSRRSGDGRPSSRYAVQDKSTAGRAYDAT